jgi:hypothetical protein
VTDLAAAPFWVPATFTLLALSSLGTPTAAMPKRAMKDKFFSILLFILLEGL